MLYNGPCSALGFLFGLAMVGLSIAANPPGDPKTLSKEVSADIRAVEKMSDKAAAKAKMVEIKAKMERIRSIDPNYFELRVLSTKFKHLENTFGSVSGGAAETAKPEAAKPAVAGAAVGDWEALVQTKRSFVPELEEVIPTYVKNVIYTEANVDEVVAKIAALRKKAPAVKQQLEAFRAKYGSDPDKIDDAMEQALASGGNRPAESAGNCFTKLSDGLTNLDEAPKIEAKRILSDALERMALIESFIADTERDKRYALADEKIRMGLKFNPADPELKAWAAKIPALRQKSKADIEKTMDAAAFPGPMAGFAGPGNPAQLVASLKTYFNQKDGSQTTLAVNIAGNWVVAKRNIFGDPIQWGLPIWAASVKKDSPEIAQVFKLTVLTEEGLGVQKSPPWTGEWVGDSFRMRARNVPAQ